MRRRKDDLVAVWILNHCSADLIGTSDLIGRNSLLLEIIELLIEIRDRQGYGRRARASIVLEHLQRSAPLEVKLSDFFHRAKSRVVEQMLVPPK